MTTPSKDEAQAPDKSVGDWRNGPSQHPRQPSHRDRPRPNPHQPRRHRRRQQPPHHQEKITNDALEQKYRRTPLNGLIIGAIVGTAWAAASGALYVQETLVPIPEEFPPLFAMSLLFPLVGWLTGLWVRTTFKLDDPKKKRFKIEIIGAVMMSFVLMVMFLIEFFVPVNDMSLTSIVAAVHPLSLIIFPCAGLALSAIGIKIENSNIPFVFGMSFSSAVVLFIAVAVWCYVFAITVVSLSS